MTVTDVIMILEGTQDHKALQSKWKKYTMQIWNGSTGGSNSSIRGLWTGFHPQPEVGLFVVLPPWDGTGRKFSYVQKSMRILKFGIYMFETKCIKSSFGLGLFVFLTVYYLGGKVSIQWVSNWGEVLLKNSQPDSWPGLNQRLKPREVKYLDSEKLCLKDCVAESGMCHITV